MGFIAHQNILILKADFVLEKNESVIERINVDLIFTERGLGKTMAKYKPYGYAQQVMIPVSLEGQLMPGTLEFAIHTLVETRIDT